MHVKNVEYVIVLGTGGYGAWGGGKTIEEAKRNFRKESNKGEVRVLLFFDCPRDQIKIETGLEFFYSWPKDKSCMRLELPRKVKKSR